MWCIPYGYPDINIQSKFKKNPQDKPHVLFKKKITNFRHNCNHKTAQIVQYIWAIRLSIKTILNWNLYLFCNLLLFFLEYIRSKIFNYKLLKLFDFYIYMNLFKLCFLKSRCVKKSRTYIGSEAYLIRKTIYFYRLGSRQNVRTDCCPGQPPKRFQINAKNAPTL